MQDGMGLPTSLDGLTEVNVRGVAGFGWGRRGAEPNGNTIAKFYDAMVANPFIKTVSFQHVPLSASLYMRLVTALNHANNRTETVIIHGANLHARQVAWLLSGNKSIKTLDVSLNAVEDEEILIHALSINTTLETLILNQNRLTQKSIENLNDFAANFRDTPLRIETENQVPLTKFASVKLMF